MNFRASLVVTILGSLLPPALPATNDVPFYYPPPPPVDSNKVEGVEWDYKVEIRTSKRIEIEYRTFPTNHPVAPTNLYFLPTVPTGSLKRPEFEFAVAMESSTNLVVWMDRDVMVTVPANKQFEFFRLRRNEDVPATTE